MQADVQYVYENGRLLSLLPMRPFLGAIAALGRRVLLLSSRPSPSLVTIDVLLAQPVFRNARRVADGPCWLTPWRPGIGTRIIRLIKATTITELRGTH